MEKEKLIELISARIVSGHLPASCEDQRIFGGSGDGRACCCCGLPITAKENQYDLECAFSKADVREFSMHLQCFNVWADVSRSASQPKGSRPEPPAAAVV